MTIYVFEDNLLWSSRLVQTLKSFGHEPLVRTAIPEEPLTGRIAIVNLGSPKIDAANLVPRLRERGVHVIGHAGHKEKEVLELGRLAGCDTIVTNSELTFKIEGLLKSVIENLENS